MSDSGEHCLREWSVASVGGRVEAQTTSANWKRSRDLLGRRQSAWFSVQASAEPVGVICRHCLGSDGSSLSVPPTKGIRAEGAGDEPRCDKLDIACPLSRAECWRIPCTVDPNVVRCALLLSLFCVFRTRGLQLSPKVGKPPVSARAKFSPAGIRLEPNQWHSQRSRRVSRKIAADPKLLDLCRFETRLRTGIPILLRFPATLTRERSRLPELIFYRTAHFSHARRRHDTRGT